MTTIINNEISQLGQLHAVPCTGSSSHDAQCVPLQLTNSGSQLPGPLYVGLSYHGNES